MAGGGGLCERHAGLRPTRDQRAASRRNAVAHAAYVRPIRDDLERDVFNDAARANADLAELRRLARANMVLRSVRLMTYEAAKGEPHPLTTKVLGQLWKATDPSEAQQPEAEGETDHAKLAALIDQVIAEDPEIFLKRMAPELQGKVRALLQEHAQAAPAGGDADAQP
jgi:hypothetical protein